MDPQKSKPENLTKPCKVISRTLFSFLFFFLILSFFITRLLEPEGLRLLRNESRHLLIKGKNHEAGDLKRLMSYYTVWANNLYPKYKFSHFAKAVGKHARGKRVKALVTEWQDEYREKMQVRRNMFSELSGQTVGGNIPSCN